MPSQAPQRWLSLNDICAVLDMDKKTVQELVKEGHLVKIGSRTTGMRYLDPTPEYAERLRFAHLYHTKTITAVPDLPHKALLTPAELGELMGWTQDYTWKVISKQKVPKIKMGRYTLLTVETVRDLLWQKGRKKAAKRNPFLLSEILEWFAKYKSAEDAAVPTDAALLEDDRFQRKMQRIATMPAELRARAMKDVVDKIELAKQTVC